MIERYDNPEDAIPYETTVLVLTETDTAFEADFTDIFDEVRERTACDKHLVEEHYKSLDDIPSYDRIIQYNLWVIHHSCLIVDGTEPLMSYLRSEAIPDETQVVVVLDTDDDTLSEDYQDSVEDEYSQRLTVLSTRDAVVCYLLGHLQTASPCSSAGLDYLLSWNNKISDNVGRHKDLE